MRLPGWYHAVPSTSIRKGFIIIYDSHGLFFLTEVFRPSGNDRIENARGREGVISPRPPQLREAGRPARREVTLSWIEQCHFLCRRDLDTQRMSGERQGQIPENSSFCRAESLRQRAQPLPRQGGFSLPRAVHKCSVSLMEGSLLPSSLFDFCFSSFETEHETLPV